MKVLKNYAYNLSYQLLVIILPIITTPYVTRVFSSEDLGTYGYFNSIVTYFILLATLGVANYGTKEISGHRKDIRKILGDLYPPVSRNICISPPLCFVLLDASIHAKSCSLYFGTQFGFKRARYLLAFSGLRGLPQDYGAKYYG